MRAAYAGALLALVPDVFMLSVGHLSLWHPMGLLGSFYDIQGRALLHGHLAVPPGSVSFEGFVIGGRTYIYFGLVPALLRLPVLMMTHALDGRLTQLSMLLALVVMLASGARIHWHVRELIRPDQPVGLADRAAAFLISFALGAGAVPLFLASWPVVYHEAELWGAALSLAAIDAVFRVMAAPTDGRIAWAGALSLLAVNTRISVGFGPIMALVLAALAASAGAAAGARGEGRRGSGLLRAIAEGGPAGACDRPLRMAALLVAAAILALGSAAAINEAKFHSAFGIPLAKQLDTQIDPAQRAFVAAYHGSAVGARFVPTTLLAAIRPDAIGTTRAFPFIGLPSSPPTVIGSVRFNALLPSLSAFTSMPLFGVLLLSGLPGLLRDRQVRPLLCVLIGTAAAFIPALSFGSIATRYLADLLPFLFVGACAGLHELTGKGRLRSSAAGRAGFATITILVLAGTVINGSVGLVQQRLLAPTTSAAERASFVQFQDDIDSFLGRAPHGVHSGSTLPTRSLGPLGDLFVLGQCDGLYVESFGGTWLPVERTDRSGLHELMVRFPAQPTPSTPAALVTLGTGTDRVTVMSSEDSTDHVAFSIRVGGRVVASGVPIATRAGHPVHVTLSFDRVGERWFLSVQIAGEGVAVDAPVPYDRQASESVGIDRDDHGVSHFPGIITTVPARTPVCDQLARRARLL